MKTQLSKSLLGTLLSVAIGTQAVYVPRSYAQGAEPASNKANLTPEETATKLSQIRESVVQLQEDLGNARQSNDGSYVVEVRNVAVVATILSAALTLSTRFVVRNPMDPLMAITLGVGTIGMAAGALTVAGTTIILSKQEHANLSEQINDVLKMIGNQSTSSLAFSDTQLLRSLNQSMKLLSSEIEISLRTPVWENDKQVVRLRDYGLLSASIGLIPVTYAALFMENSSDLLKLSSSGKSILAASVAALFGGVYAFTKSSRSAEVTVDKARELLRSIDRLVLNLDRLEQREQGAK